MWYCQIRRVAWCSHKQSTSHQGGWIISQVWFVQVSRNSCCSHKQITLHLGCEKRHCGENLQRRRLLLGTYFFSFGLLWLGCKYTLFGSGCIFDLVIVGHSLCSCSIKFLPLKKIANWRKYSFCWTAFCNFVASCRFHRWYSCWLLSIKYGLLLPLYEVADLYVSSDPPNSFSSIKKTLNFIS